LDQTIRVEKQAQKWTHVIGNLTFVVGNYLQAAYVGLQKLLQAEWQFPQGVTEGIDVEFSGIEHALHTQFLPALLGKEKIMNSRRYLTCLPIKKASLVIPNPMELARENWTASPGAYGHLIVSLQRCKEKRIQIGDTPINHDKRESGDMKDEFGNNQRKDGDYFTQATEGT
jgi:hypothetical protein